MAAMAVAAVMAAGAAQAVTTITNTASANFTNEAAVAQTAVTGSTTFTAQSDPVLSVIKTGDKAAGPSGTVVTWRVRVAYPRVADVPLVCGDDSKAQGVVITDPIPAGFTYSAGTLRVSNDDAVTFSVATDAVGGDPLGFDVSFGAGTVTANCPDLVEGQGDTVNCGASPAALVIEFKATKN
ncbi:MAG: hypothetical protein AAB152_02930 [Candidatus Coatesbacteria bacterium]